MINTKILSGKEVSENLKENLSLDIDCLKKEGITPGLAAIIVGDNPASKVYVNSKSKYFSRMGCYSETFCLKENSKELDIIKLIEQLNLDEKFHGILLQLPLPSRFNSDKILSSIVPQKDVDGFHIDNIGKLFSGKPLYIPCTPNGIIKILEHYDIETSGKHAVIIGRSNIVGLPMFALLAQKFEKGNSTVTMCNSRTPDIEVFTKQADILVVAVGKPNIINSKMIKEGVHIIDVGINRVEDGNMKKGYRIVGDVSNDIIGKAGSVTPVPGGVGPMTITMLLYNTVMSAKKSFN